MNPKRKLEREAHQLSESARVPFVWFEKESSRSREAVKPTFLRNAQCDCCLNFRLHSEQLIKVHRAELFHNHTIREQGCLRLVPP